MENGIVNRTAAPQDRIPGGVEVTEVLRRIGEKATALDLCMALEAEGYGTSRSQIGIQRAVERRDIILNPDWNLSVPDERPMP